MSLKPNIARMSVFQSGLFPAHILILGKWEGQFDRRTLTEERQIYTVGNSSVTFSQLPFIYSYFWLLLFSNCFLDVTLLFFARLCVSWGHKPQASISLPLLQPGKVSSRLSSGPAPLSLPYLVSRSSLELLISMLVFSLFIQQKIFI